MPTPRDMMARKPWAMAPEAVARLKDLASRVRIENARPDDQLNELAEMIWGGENPIIERDGALAIIHLAGPIDYRPALWETLFFNVIPSDWIVDACRELENDGTVGAVLLECNCPGGSVFGLSDADGSLRALRDKKPLYAIAHEYATSLAYLYGCRALEFAATPTAITGSIGSIIPMFDDSELYKKLGVEPKPLVSEGADHKAVGMSGLPLTPENTAHLQRIVDQGGEMFLSFVSEERGIPVEKLRAMKGEMFTAADAMKLGLIDRVVDFTAYRAEVRSIAETNLNKERNMDLKTGTVAQLRAEAPNLVSEIEKGVKDQADKDLAARALAPATFAELNAAIPDGTPNKDAQIVASLKAGHTVVACLSALVALGSASNKELTEKVTKLEAAKVAAGAQSPGRAPLSIAPGTETDAKGSAYIQKCREIAATEKGDLNKAINSARKAFPSLYREWVDAGRPKVTLEDAA